VKITAKFSGKDIPISSQPSKTFPVLDCLFNYFSFTFYFYIMWDRSLTTEAAKTLIQAFVFCRLDYCNSLVVWCVWRPQSEAAGQSWDGCSSTL